MRISAVDDEFNYDSDVYEERDHSEDDEVIPGRSDRSAIESNTIAVRPSQRAQYIRVRGADSTTTTEEEEEAALPTPSPPSSPIHELIIDENASDSDEEEIEQFAQMIPPPDYNPFAEV